MIFTTQSGEQEIGLAQVPVAGAWKIRSMHTRTISRY